jgi:hypothetical protein
MSSSPLPLPAFAQQWRDAHEARVAACRLPLDPEEERADPHHARRCPDWLRQPPPARWRAFTGKEGIPEPWRSIPRPLGMNARGWDRWQANHFLVCREETRDFIAHEFPPHRAECRPGALPEFEKVAARFTAGLATPTDKALALLTRALPQVLPHPTVPPLGPMCPTNRGLDDDGLLRSGCGYCNEQARVFIRLCQVSGIPARLCFLFYSDRKTGHTTAEFLVEGRWALADVSWYCVVPGPDGRLLGAAECLEPRHQSLVGEAFARRMAEIAAMGDGELAGRAYADVADPAERARQTALAAAALRAEVLARNAAFLSSHLWCFGVLPHPLPPAAS